MSILINILCLAAAVLPAMLIAERLLAAVAAAACNPLAANINSQTCNRALTSPRQPTPASKAPRA